MKNFCVVIRNKLDADIQVLKNICLYCMGDFYLSHKIIECRFETSDQKNEFLDNLHDLEVEIIG